jgi:hypothetical protein
VMLGPSETMKMAPRKKVAALIARLRFFVSMIIDLKMEYLMLFFKFVFFQ